MKLRKYILPRNIRDSICFMFSITIIPVSYWFLVFTVLPSIYTYMSVMYCFHVVISTVFMINITSNFVYMLLQDCSILGEIMPSTKLSPNWKFCDICETVTPPRSFHCDVCNVCILKRDHHCQFVACCVGHQNQRYFLYFLLYGSIASIYSLFFNTIFILQNTTLTLNSLIKFVFPLAVFVLGIDISVEHIYTILYVINVLCMMTATILFVYHFNNVIHGKIMHEKNHKINDYDNGSFKENIIQVAGKRWYLTWLSPFIESKLPHDGINWVKFNNVKND